MKITFVGKSVLGLSAIICWATLAASSGLAQQTETFPGVRKVLTPDQYVASGLSKLSPEERANLDEYLRAYVSGTTQRVATQAANQAVTQAVKERRVSPPTTVESRIVGTLSGINDRTIIVLENGDRYRVTDGQVRRFAPVTNAPVIVVRDFFSSKLAIPGAGIIRVQKL